MVLPIAKKHRGSAHRGISEWLVQRLSAVYLAGFVLFVMTWLVLQPIHSYEQWHAWFYQDAMRLASALFLISLLLHVWIGLHSVYMDYVPRTGPRLMLLLLTACGGEASVENASEHSYCRPFPFLKGHSLF